MQKRSTEIKKKKEFVTLKKFVYILAICIANYSCTGKISSFTQVNREPAIFPDYSMVTFPPNIAPANFIIEEKADKFIVKIHSAGKNEITIISRSGSITIPEKKWKKALQASKGKELLVEVFARKSGDWNKYSTIVNYIANEPVDNYLVYRLIEPGFETWNKMGIYQRCLGNFNEKPIMINEMSDANCMNCHAFSSNNGNIMMFHMRGQHAGTILFRNGKLEKVNTKTEKTISPGVYPAWHPNGRYIAFSVNNIIQVFHSVAQMKVEVIDTLSDVILFDTETNKITTCDALSTKENLETFPAWSPDGKYLYYCSAKMMAADKYNELRYNLLRIAFDPELKLFGKVDTVVSAADKGLSVSFPRVSPDGKYVLFCMSAYGNFSIWHPESDLYLKNLRTGEISKPDINSTQAESYHSWSSTGRWIVFSSRRLDGLFTRPFFSYFDSAGMAHKPFILPQKDPSFYKTFLKSYNVPELITTKVKLNPRKLSRLNKTNPVQGTFENLK
jgi:hypothetical protein